MVETASLRKDFEELYGKAPRLFSAPGRVNLIGEHTDYNDGFVLPVAINRRTYVAAAARDDRQVRVRSLDLDEDATFALDDCGQTFAKKWIAYVAGVARILEKEGIGLTGSDLVIASDVPMGAGLSSSAALEMSAGKAFVALVDDDIDSISLALAAQKAEHIYAGTKCGIMDQLTAAAALRDHALLIDCRSLEVAHIPCSLRGAVLVICNTNVKHELASSAYNQRRAECERGVEILRKKLPGIQALRDLSVREFEQYQEALPAPLRRRCRHVVTENERTLNAAEVLRQEDLPALGKLMVMSHQSLRDDYQVSSVELDTMVDLAMKHAGVFGARMTGGGFGGCTVNIVQRDALDNFCNAIRREYRARTNIEPAIYVVEADTGMNEIHS